MAKIYFYKMTVDDGGAPCVDGDLLTLAICMQAMRRTARPGDFIFGFAANSLHQTNRLIYVARITDRKWGDDYYGQSRFRDRGDCIYERRADRFVWRTKALHHCQNYVTHDLGVPPDYVGAWVLLSDDFRYFGRTVYDSYRDRYPLVGDAVRRHKDNHRVNHGDDLRQQLEELKNDVWRSYKDCVLGQPTSKPDRRVCHRD